MKKGIRLSTTLAKVVTDESNREKTSFMHEAEGNIKTVMALVKKGRALAA